MSQLILNHETVALPRAANTRLLDFIRHGAGLTAAKPACNGGDCGACLVLLGEIAPGETAPRYRAVNSCLLATGLVAGCHVITPEGLGGEALTPVQQALVDHGAIQCGYCTPGLTVALTAALLNGDPLADAAGGNLCRCTGYAGTRRAAAALEAAYPRQRRTLAEAAALGLVPEAVAAAGARLSPLPADPLHWPQRETVVAGDTDWSVQHAHHRNGQGPWLNLHRVPALRRIDADDEALTIGAAVTVAEIQRSPLVAADWPEWPGFLERFASPSIRNSATIGGNLVNASPVADLAVILLALDAELAIESPAGPRRMPLAAFYHGYHETGLGAHALLAAIRIPRNPGSGRRLHFDKVAKREFDDIATVTTAMGVGAGTPGHFGSVRLAAGGVGPFPLRLDAVAAALAGEPVTSAAVRKAMAQVDGAIAPIDDLRGTARYKAGLLRHLLVAHVAALYPDSPEFSWQECLA